MACMSIFRLSDTGFANVTGLFATRDLKFDIELSGLEYLTAERILVLRQPVEDDSETPYVYAARRVLLLQCHLRTQVVYSSAESIL